MRRVDWTLFACVAAIGVVGWMVLCSATVRATGVGPDAVRQAVYIGVGLLAMLGCSVLDVRVLRLAALPTYLLSVGLLALVMLPGFGHSANGAQRWVNLGVLGTLQPSELAKLSLVLALAWVLGRREGAMRWPALGVCCVLVMVPVALIMLQPDLGTALVLLAVTAVELFIAGCSPALLLGVVAAGAAVAPHVLKGYQRDRLLVFMNPEIDPRGLGYNLIQSRTAIGAGGMWGDGLFFGMMSQLHYVPEQRTDFIFSVMGEELGFIGCVAFMALYVLLLVCLVRCAWRCTDRFGTLLISGVCALFAFHVFVNIGMTVGLLPVVGIPLPLVSYGGTAVLTDLMAVGLVAAVSAREEAPRVSDAPMLVSRVA